MSGFVCLDCGTQTNIFRSRGGEKISQEFSISLLGKISLDPKICLASDLGHPFFKENPNLSAYKAIRKIVDKIKGYIQEREKVD